MRILLFLLGWPCHRNARQPFGLLLAFCCLPGARAKKSFGRYAAGLLAGGFGRTRAAGALGRALLVNGSRWIAFMPLMFVTAASCAVGQPPNRPTIATAFQTISGADPTTMVLRVAGQQVNPYTMCATSTSGSGKPITTFSLGNPPVRSAASALGGTLGTTSYCGSAGYCPCAGVSIRFGRWRGLWFVLGLKFSQRSATRSFFRDRRVFQENSNSASVATG